MHEFSYDTRDVEDWKQVWVAVRRRTHMMFKVKACSDVKILMGPIIFNTEHLNNYLITIDGNGSSSMIE